MRKISKFLLAGGLLLTGFLGITNTRNEVKEVDAADPTTKWGVIGSFSGSGWSKDFGFEYDSADKRFECIINFETGNEFKLRYNNSWSKEMGYDNNFNSNSNIPTYCTQSGTNFKIREGGSYTLCLDAGVESYTYGYTYALSIFKNEDVKEFTVTHYTMSGEVLGTDTVLENSPYNPAFKEEEGYRLEGWYTEPELTNKFAKGTAITSNVNLYPKYVEAEDYTIYFQAAWTKVNVWSWRENTDGGNIADAWPGLALTKGENGKWVFNIDASKSLDMVIFNDGTNQTVDLTLEGLEDGDTYVLGAKNSEGKYTATVEKAPAKPVLSLAVTPVENAGVKFYAGFPAEVADQVKNENVGFKFVFSGESVETKTGYYVCESTTQTITNIVDGEPVTLNAADAGYAFYFGVIVENIPEGYNHVEVTPAYQHTNGSTVLLEAKTLDFTVVDGVVNF